MSGGVGFGSGVHDGERAEWPAALRMGGCRGGSGARLGRVCAGGGAKGRPGGAEGFPRFHLAAGARWTKSTGGVRRAAGETEQPICDF